MQTLAQLTVLNETTFELVALYCCLVADCWGPDLIDQGMSIAAGGTYQMTDLEAGVYNLRAEFEGGYVEKWLGVTLVESEEETWRIEQPPEPATMTIENNSAEAIREINMRVSGTFPWGDDLLQENLSPGESFTIEDIEAGTYDFRILAEVGIGRVWSDVDLAEGAQETWSVDTMPAKLTVVNQSSEAAHSIFLREAGTSEWGNDLYNDPQNPWISSGGSYTVTGIEPGIYDLFVESFIGGWLVEDLEFDEGEEVVVGLQD
jgi:hypothetical protein